VLSLTKKDHTTQDTKTRDNHKQQRKDIKNSKWEERLQTPSISLFMSARLILVANPIIVEIALLFLA